MGCGLSSEAVLGATDAPPHALPCHTNKAYLAAAQQILLDELTFDNSPRTLSAFDASLGDLISSRHMTPQPPSKHPADGGRLPSHHRRRLGATPSQSSRHVSLNGWTVMDHTGLSVTEAPISSTYFSDQSTNQNPHHMHHPASGGFSTAGSSANFSSTSHATSVLSSSLSCTKSGSSGGHSARGLAGSESPLHFPPIASATPRTHHQQQAAAAAAAAAASVQARLSVRRPAPLYTGSGSQRPSPPQQERSWTESRSSRSGAGGHGGMHSKSTSKTMSDYPHRHHHQQPPQWSRQSSPLVAERILAGARARTGDTHQQQTQERDNISPRRRLSITMTTTGFDHPSIVPFVPQLHYSPSPVADDSMSFHQRMGTLAHAYEEADDQQSAPQHTSAAAAAAIALACSFLPCTASPDTHDTGCQSSLIGDSAHLHQHAAPHLSSQSIHLQTDVEPVPVMSKDLYESLYPMYKNDADGYADYCDRWEAECARLAAEEEDAMRPEYSRSIYTSPEGVHVRSTDEEVDGEKDQGARPSSHPRRCPSTNPETGLYLLLAWNHPLAASSSLSSFLLSTGADGLAPPRVPSIDLAVLDRVGTPPLDGRFDEATHSVVERFHFHGGRRPATAAGPTAVLAEVIQTPVDTRAIVAPIARHAQLAHASEDVGSSAAAGPLDWDSVHDRLNRLAAEHEADADSPSSLGGFPRRASVASASRVGVGEDELADRPSARECEETASSSCSPRGRAESNSSTSRSLSSHHQSDSNSSSTSMTASDVRVCTHLSEHAAGGGVGATIASPTPTPKQPHAARTHHLQAPSPLQHQLQQHCHYQQQQQLKRRFPTRERLMQAGLM